MSATPTYDDVVEDLRVDPEQIAARAAWSFQAARRRLEHEASRQPRTSGDRRVQPQPRQVPARQKLSVPGPPAQAAAAT